MVNLWQKGYVVYYLNQMSFSDFEQTVVACHHYASYHSSSNFAWPDSFIPERWLGNDPRFTNDKKDVLQPFSLGPRNCLGKK